MDPAEIWTINDSTIVIESLWSTETNDVLIAMMRATARRLYPKYDIDIAKRVLPRSRNIEISYPYDTKWRFKFKDARSKTLAQLRFGSSGAFL